MTAPGFDLERAKLARTLAEFALATPALLADRHLLRRADTKFVLSPHAVAGILAGVADAYAVVPVGDDHLATYANIYFDTSDLQCFHDHRRGRRHRHKIRIRSYVDRRLAFIEVKSRRNEVQTDKARLQIPYGTDALDPALRAFVARHCSFDDLVPAVAIDYRRIMLAGLATEERVTIDLGITVDRDAGLAVGAVAIVEVKQPTRSFATPIMRAIREAGHAPCSVSKYVMALAPRPTVRANRFLPSLRRLERIAHK